MKCAIMQPTFLPWAGYFNLIGKVDTFVFLDDAQFEKNSWQNRNKILVDNQIHWITVPVSHQSHLQKINQTMISTKEKWNSRLVKTISQNYSKHPFFSEIGFIIEIIKNNTFENLSSLNCCLIKNVIDRMNLQAKILQSSSLGINGIRTDRLIKILEHIGATEYLSPVGARGYLETDKFEEKTSVKLHYQEFILDKYSQFKNKGEFASHLSFIDVVCNIGFYEFKNYIKSSFSH